MCSTAARGNLDPQPGRRSTMAARARAAGGIPAGGRPPRWRTPPTPFGAWNSRTPQPRRTTSTSARSPTWPSRAGARVPGSTTPARRAGGPEATTAASGRGQGNVAPWLASPCGTSIQAGRGDRRVVSRRVTRVGDDDTHRRITARSRSMRYPAPLHVEATEPWQGTPMSTNALHRSTIRRRPRTTRFLKVSDVARAARRDPGAKVEAVLTALKKRTAPRSRSSRARPLSSTPGASGTRTSSSTWSSIRRSSSG